MWNGQHVERTKTFSPLKSSPDGIASYFQRRSQLPVHMPQATTLPTMAAAISSLDALAANIFLSSGSLSATIW